MKDERNVNWRCLDQVRTAPDTLHRAAAIPRTATRPRYMARVALAVACAAVVLLGVGIVWRDRDSTPPPVAPSVEPTATMTTTMETTPTTTRLPDFTEGIGGDIWITGIWNWNLYPQPDVIIGNMQLDELITEDDLSAWYDQFSPEYADYDPVSEKHPYEECSIYTFVRDFAVSREYLEICNERHKEAVGFPIYSEEALDLIYGNDEEAFIAYFASPTAVVVNKRIFSVRWLENHTVEEWEQVGIHSFMIGEKVTIWETYFGYESTTNDSLTLFFEKVEVFIE